MSASTTLRGLWELGWTGGRDEDMEGEHLKSRVGKERVEPIDPRRQIGILEVPLVGPSRIASSSESLMTCTLTSDGSILAVGWVGTWTVDVKLRGVTKTVDADS